MIGITHGVVGYIDNASGHYRPSRKNLLFGLQALRDQIGDLAMENVIVRDHSTAYSMTAYSAKKFLLMNGFCLPMGFYRDTKGRYDEKLIRFQSPEDARLYFENEDKDRELKKLKMSLTRLIEKYEIYESKKKGKLDNDDEREVVKLALLRKMLPVQQAQEYVKNDPPMQEWLRRYAYSYKIMV